jgi:hypothetical protein
MDGGTDIRIIHTIGIILTMAIITLGDGHITQILTGTDIMMDTTTGIGTVIMVIHITLIQVILIMEEGTCFIQTDRDRVKGIPGMQFSHQKIRRCGTRGLVML